jgi:hypothetical protein
VNRHLIPLGSGGWSLWRWVWLRGAGFAAEDVQPLGADAIDQALACEGEIQGRVDRCRAAAIAACDAALADGHEDRQLRNALDHLHAGWTRMRPSGVAVVDAAVEQLRGAIVELARCREATDEVVRRERARIGERIREIARDPRFREALIWQNRSVVHNALDGLLEASPGAENAKVRKRQRVIARYVQRYAVKNDSIGFFGPVGWGSVEPAVPGFTATPGPTLVDQRVVSFEDWAIEAVAAQLSNDPAVHAVFTPRRRPSSWLEGNTLHVPPGAPRQLTPAEAWLIARVDGERSAGGLADAAAADPASGIGTADEAMRELSRLGRENVISWRIEVPAELDQPERWLRERLARIADPVARARAAAPLERLEAARARVAQAAGDPGALDASVAALEDEFQAATELSPKRGHGRTYAGRQTFFEDCRRAVDLRVGRAMLDALDGPLTLILHSARWYSYEIARRFRAGFDEAYDRALANATTRPLPLTSFLAESRGLFSPDHHRTGPIVTVVQSELQRRWANILGIDKPSEVAGGGDPDGSAGGTGGLPRGIDRADRGVRSLVFHAEECRARVAELFHAPGPGWPRARYHSPDVMIAAASTDRIARGEFLAVLGEVHPGLNTLLTHVAYRLHPERAAVDEAYEADLAMACISPIQSALGRVTNSPLTLRDHHVEVGPTRSWRPRDQVHLAGDLYVERAGDRLHVRSRVRDLDHDIISFMEAYLGVEAVPHFKLLPRARHLPRVTIDKLVVSRERWDLERSEFRALVEDGGDAEADPVRRVAAWAKRLGLPRYVFGTVPHEPKPFYVDLGSPIYIDVFVRYLTDATALGVSEMLPGPRELWLLDGDGRSYTSELRFAAVDPQRWSPNRDLVIMRQE